MRPLHLVFLTTDHPARLAQPSPRRGPPSSICVNGADQRCAVSDHAPGRSLPRSAPASECTSISVRAAVTSSTSAHFFIARHSQHHWSSFLPLHDPCHHLCTLPLNDFAPSSFTTSPDLLLFPFLVVPHPILVHPPHSPSPSSSAPHPTFLSHPFATNTQVHSHGESHVRILSLSCGRYLRVRKVVRAL